LIGWPCTHSNVFSGPVLIRRGLDFFAHRRRYAVLRVRPSRVPGGFSEGETPLPIPNRVVKPLSADGTPGEGPRESRSLPGVMWVTGPEAHDAAGPVVVSGT